jgi:hypothetical protein
MKKVISQIMYVCLYVYDLAASRKRKIDKRKERRVKRQSEKRKIEDTSYPKASYTLKK